MLNTRTKYFSGMVSWVAGIVCSCALIVATAVAHGSIQDRRVDMLAAQKMAEIATTKDFPVVVNAAVLAQLNRFLSTPDGRAFIRQGLSQMQNHKENIVEHLDKYNLPQELLAVPLIESGYKNLPQGKNPKHGAGLWMFVRQTAQNFGLRVDDQVDERLDVSLETSAAARLLASLHLQFQDWGLALLAYNAGQNLVQRGIQETGQRDVWELGKKGYEADSRYVASVMAAVLILKNPSSIAD